MNTVIGRMTPREVVSRGYYARPERMSVAPGRTKIRASPNSRWIERRPRYGGRSTRSNFGWRWWGSISGGRTRAEVHGSCLKVSLEVAEKGLHILFNSRHGIDMSSAPIDDQLDALSEQNRRLVLENDELTEQNGELDTNSRI